ncbi:MAG: NifU family protein [Fimbriimonadaceae bacterium]|nr:NifU family protein [Fimbriimonadaceae bacterium]
MSLLSRLLGKRGPAPTEMGPLYEPVREAMREVQAYARSHGGQIHLLGVSPEGDVTIRMTGTCSGCPLSDITLKVGIERQLRLLVPGVGRVVQVQ